MTLSIFPTVNDVGGSGAGKYATEANLAKFLKRIMWRNSVISGGTYINASGLTANIASVEATIEGYIANETAQLQAVCQANATNYIYWQLTRDGQNYVTGAQIVVNQTGADPADAVKLMALTTDGTTVTVNVDARPLNYYDSLLGHKHNPIAASDGGTIPFSSLMFGDGSDGDFSSTGNVTLEAGADDAGPVVKQYKSFTLNAGHTMTVDRRSKGLVLFIQGNCMINGTIDMNNLAARVTRLADPFGTAVAVVSWPHIFSWQLVTMLLPAGGAGGAGGNGGTSYSGGLGGSGGGAGSNCAFGGSGGGGGGSGITRDINNYPSGAGGGGAGNGGAGGNGATANASSNPGSPGGVGSGMGGAGGAAGVYGSWSSPPGSPGGAGGGGIIIIICRGNITIGVGGIVRANSSGAGGAGSTANPSGQSGDGGGGGGAGGGIVFIAYGGTYTNNGAIQVNASSGGATGTSDYPGTAGGAGQAGAIYTVKAGGCG